LGISRQGRLAQACWAEAGEASGALSEVLRRLVEHYERMQETREKIVMALVYPGIVMTLGLATLVFSMVFVVPKFKAAS
jgi:type II secretory pathway component PulF